MPRWWNAPAGAPKLPSSSRWHTGLAAGPRTFQPHHAHEAATKCADLPARSVRTTALPHRAHASQRRISFAIQPEPAVPAWRA